MKITPGALTLADLRQYRREGGPVTLDDGAKSAVDASYDAVQKIAAADEAVYGINTGFGKLAQVRIPKDQLTDLQTNLVTSHAVGTGALLADSTVRLILLLKIAALARGHSGIRWQVIEHLTALLNADVLPCIPSKGSVGASGDLAPLAHMASVLLGIGEVRHDGERLSAEDGLAQAGLTALTLEPKEGLALLNGTQVSTALAVEGLFAAEDALAAAVVIGALSVDAAKGSDTPFDARIHDVRGQLGQIKVAQAFRDLLSGSEIRKSHLMCDRVQDPYSLRCQPQVIGACLDQIGFAADILLRECNAVSDNPLVFLDNGDVLSGGNFHAEPVAMAADNLALAIAELGALSERRAALLIDANLSGLPPFLIEEGGVNSGFMIAHVTAAALASENKSLAHPASVDSLPTSANQEDHVSMATFAARRLGDMADNTAGILAVEMLMACQGIDFHRPLVSSEKLMAVHAQIREQVAFLDQDRYLAPDIESAKKIVSSGALTSFAGEKLVPSMAA